MASTARILYGLVESSRTSKWQKVAGPRRDLIRAAAWAGFLTAAISIPWLSKGYLFGTDWPGFRHFDWPTTLSSSAPLQALLALASVALGSEWTGKLLVFGSLFGAALFAYRAAPTEQPLVKAAAATVYAVNPFVYGRIQYGQLFIVLAYAMLPWTVSRIRKLIETPGMTTAAYVAVAVALEAVASPHLALMAVLIGACGLVSFAALSRASGMMLRRALWTLASIGVSVALMSYWIVPLLAGSGYEGALVARAPASAIGVFAAVGDPASGLVANLLGLYGFWAEATGRFISAKAFAPGWIAVLGVILLISLVGAVVTLRSGSSSDRWWVAGLLGAAGIALFLEAGYSAPASRWFVLWLDTVFPPYRGMRDAGKWAAVLALLYSQLLPLGGAAVIAWVGRFRPGGTQVERIAAVVAAALVASPLYYGNALLFGAHGQIRPSEYPAGWYAADALLASDKAGGRTLFLPWHEYMSYSFVQNTDNVIAAPGPSFFSVPVIVSADPEVAGLAAPSSADQAVVDALVEQGAAGNWARQLSSIGVTHILLARELDWQRYQFLRSQPGIAQLGDFGPITVFAVEPPVSQ